MKAWLLFMLVVWAGASIAQTEPAKFSEALQAKFHHERCLQCHQFNSRRSNGRSYHSHRSRYLCDTCHKPGLTGLPPSEWMAPEGERMDYTNMSARDTCLMAFRNIGSGNKAQMLQNHLLHDHRVLWAIKSGMTPAGQREVLPGGLTAWERDVKRWVEGGMLCE